MLVLVLVLVLVSVVVSVLVLVLECVGMCLCLCEMKVQPCYPQSRIKLEVPQAPARPLEVFLARPSMFPPSSRWAAWLHFASRTGQRRFGLMSGYKGSQGLMWCNRFAACVSGACGNHFHGFSWPGLRNRILESAYVAGF